MTGLIRKQSIRGLAVALAAFVLLVAAGARAASIGDLYQVLVTPASGGTPAALRQGMADVLVRVTGRRDAAALPALAPLVSDAARYVTSYRRAAGGRLAITFDGDAIEQAIAAANLPFWGENRPATLVWLAVDRGGGQRGLVTADATSRERRAVDLAAEERGVPLVWPTDASPAQARTHFEQAWSGNVEALMAAAQPYGTQAVLIGRAVRAGGDYSVDWTFVGAGGRFQARGDLADGVDMAADRFASVYASVGAAQRQQVVVTVTGVSTLAQFADVSRSLSALPAVRGVVLHEAQPDALQFTVSVRGGAAELRRQAAVAGRLRALGTAADSLTFAYQP